MLLALYAGAQIPFGLMRDASVAIEPSGDWSFRIPVEDSPSEVLRRIGSARIDSIDFMVPGADVVTFTLGLPVYLAVALAIPSRGRLRPLMWGSVLQLAIGIISVLLCAEVMAYVSLAQMRPDASALASWARTLLYHLLTAVVPYVAPLVAVVWLHPELRREIFPLSADEITQK